MTYFIRKTGENTDQRQLYRRRIEVAEINYFSDPGQGGVIAEVSLHSSGLTRYLSEEIITYITKRGEDKIQYWGSSQTQVDEEILKDFGPEFSFEA